MDIQIRDMLDGDREAVAAIFKEGVDTGKAIFEENIPEWDEWDAAHLKIMRFVAVVEGRVAGWVALSKLSRRPCFHGIAEVSIYIDGEFRGRGVGQKLLNHLVAESEKAGFWTLQSVIMSDNERSLKLHEKCGFYTVGVRRRMARDWTGRWRDCVLMEKRSETVGMD